MPKKDKLAARLRRGDTAALGEVIERYTPYAYAIAENVLGGMLGEADAEEITADAFTALWYNRANVQDGALKAYLAAIVRNKAKSRLRALRIAEPLEDDIPIAECALPEQQYILTELCDIARDAVSSLPEPDCEIFKRHYFLYQRTEDIAADMGLPGATVRTKLARGRKRLKAYLTERGFDCDSLYI